MPPADFVVAHGLVFTFAQDILLCGFCQPTDCLFNCTGAASFQCAPDSPFPLNLFLPTAQPLLFREELEVLGESMTMYQVRLLLRKVD